MNYSSKGEARNSKKVEGGKEKEEQQQTASTKERNYKKITPAFLQIANLPEISSNVQCHQNGVVQRNINPKIAQFDSIPCSEDGGEGICELLAAESLNMRSLVVSYRKNCFILHIPLEELNPWVAWQLAVEEARPQECVLTSRCDAAELLSRETKEKSCNELASLALGPKRNEPKLRSELLESRGVEIAILERETEEDLKRGRVP
ncbi:hypothetical protein Cgig2_028947 [Carnegiea gigantea]|uniref:Uncharacterized protein n=1 Tax=Carnegiea gigantea TaxID=171969 RepID=A0A9Q1Q8A3_9CARY|nr:hypothetical protein Cgig2_028947 [Carnegiea gigantea]